MFSYDTYRFDWTFHAAVAALGRLPANWLDLGCHNATLVKLLLDRGVPEVTGIDVYDPQLQQESTWTYLRHDLDEGEIPLSSERFEVVSGLEVIEHVTDTDSFLREVFRVLRPGGVVVLTTPNINMMKNRVRVPLGLYPHSLEYRTNIHHVRLYNAQCLRDHLAEHGFVVETLVGHNLLPKRWMGPRLLRWASRTLAIRFPTLCSAMMVVARKPVAVAPRESTESAAVG